MSPPSLGVVLVGSADPERLRAWYADSFGVREDVTGRLRFANTTLLIDLRPVGPRAAEPGRVILTFDVDDIRAVEARLVEREVVWLREVEASAYGPIGTLVDPDGNYVQVMQANGRRS